MKCIKCGGDTRVVERRQLTCTLYVRRRECKRCRYRFNTHEVLEKIEKQPLPVVLDTR